MQTPTVKPAIQKGDVKCMNRLGSSLCIFIVCKYSHLLLHTFCFFWYSGELLSVNPTI